MASVGYNTPEIAAAPAKLATVGPVSAWVGLRRRSRSHQDIGAFLQTKGLTDSKVVSYVMI